MKTLINTLEKTNTKKLQLAFLLLSTLIITPLFLHNQWYTGTLVNSILVLTLLQIGLQEAILFCFIPSVVVFATGTLPSPLLPIIPFIITSNLILVLIIDQLKKRNFKKITILFIAPFLKFICLYGTWLLIMPFLLSETLIIKTATIFGGMQFITALLGTSITFLINQKWKK